jgi:hypothetical protein
VLEDVAGFRWSALNLSEWQFPDPTFSGLLPGMTSTQDLIDFSVRMDSAGFYDLPGDLNRTFQRFSLSDGSYKLISIDGVDCLDVAQTSSFTSFCEIGTDSIYDADIYLFYNSCDPLNCGGPPVGVAASFNIQSWSGTPALEGSYLTFDNFNGTHYLELALEDFTLFIGATLTAIPGHTAIDSWDRLRGGSVIQFDYLGSTWVFERQSSQDAPFR